MSVDWNVRKGLHLKCAQERELALWCAQDSKFADERARGNDHVFLLDVGFDSSLVHCTKEILNLLNVVQCTTYESTGF